MFGCAVLESTENMALQIVYTFVLRVEIGNHITFVSDFLFFLIYFLLAVVIDFVQLTAYCSILHEV